MAAIAPIGLALGLLGTAGATYGQVQASRTQAKARDAEARSVDAQARHADAQAAFDETQQRRQNNLMLGQATATAAASGIDITSGSPLLMELDRVKQTEIEALNVGRAGRNQAAAIRSVAAAKRFDAQMERRQIPYQIMGGVAQGGSILSMYAKQGGFNRSPPRRRGFDPVYDSR